VSWDQPLLKECFFSFPVDNLSLQLFQIRAGAPSSRSVFSPRTLPESSFLRDEFLHNLVMVSRLLVATRFLKGIDAATFCSAPLVSLRRPTNLTECRSFLQPPFFFDTVFSDLRSAEVWLSSFLPSSGCLQALVIHAFRVEVGRLFRMRQGSRRPFPFLDLVIPWSFGGLPPRGCSRSLPPPRRGLFSVSSSLNNFSILALGRSFRLIEGLSFCRRSGFPPHPQRCATWRPASLFFDVFDPPV